MKAPFLLLAALILSYSGNAVAAPLTAEERQEKADEAKFRLAEFDKFHPSRAKWSADDEKRHEALERATLPAMAPLRPREAALSPVHHSEVAHKAPAHPAPRTAAERRKLEIMAKLEGAWNRIEDASDGVRDGIADAFDTIRDGASDVAFEGWDATRRVRHDRPLMFSNYVDVVKKGNQVSLVYCDSRLFRMDPTSGQHCEKLHQGSFSVAELRSCLNSAQDNKQPGMILNRQLESMDANDREFGVEHFKMYDTKENYGQYLKSCHARTAGRHPIAAKPRVAKIPAMKAPRLPASPQPALAPAPVHSDIPPLDFHTIDQPEVMAAPAVEGNGTL
jgi:hypothetical protein